MNGFFCLKVEGKADVANEVLKKLIGWKHPDAGGWLSSNYHSAITDNILIFINHWKAGGKQNFITFEVTRGLVFGAYSGSDGTDYKELDLKTFLKAKTLQKALQIKFVKHRSLKKRMEEVMISLKECNEVLRGHVATNDLQPHNPFTRAFEKSRDILNKYAAK